MRLRSFIIIGFLISGLSLFLFMNSGCQIKDSVSIRISNDIKVLNYAIADYQQTNGVLPGSLDELVGVQLRELKLDPWGNSYQYDPSKKTEQRIFSLGADGEPGGDGLAAEHYLEVENKNLANSL